MAAIIKAGYDSADPGHHNDCCHQWAVSDAREIANELAENEKPTKPRRPRTK
jgi:hypothetical protein